MLGLSWFSGGRANFYATWKYSLLSLHIQGAFQVLAARGIKRGILAIKKCYYVCREIGQRIMN